MEEQYYNAICFLMFPKSKIQQWDRAFSLQHCNLVRAPIKANVFGKQQDVFKFLGCIANDEHVLAVPCVSQPQG